MLNDFKLYYTVFCCYLSLLHFKPHLLRLKNWECCLSTVASAAILSQNVSKCLQSTQLTPKWGVNMCNYCGLPYFFFFFFCFVMWWKYDFRMLTRCCPLVPRQWTRQCPSPGSCSHEVSSCLFSRLPWMDWWMDGWWTCWRPSPVRTKHPPSEPLTLFHL